MSTAVSHAPSDHGEDRAPLDLAQLAARHHAMFDANAAEPQKQPRIRERAARLGVSEAHLVAAQLGVSSVPLALPAPRILADMPSVGRVMALTRNDDCVHERHGRYEDVQAHGAIGLVVGPDIDLRLFFDHWHHGYAVTENGRSSLQFFDGRGQAVHKIYRTEETDGPAWEALIERHRKRDDAPMPAFDAPAASEQVTEQAAEPAAPTADAPRAEVDVTRLRERWLALHDTHGFHPMLRKLKLSRLSALAHVGPDLAQQVPTTSVEAMMNSAATTSLPIMCFVGNPGAIQIHSGPIHRLMRTGPWFNVLDPIFNLHLNTTAIDSAWVVNKPSDDGWITSLEAFARDGTLIVQFFGARKPGKPELPAWRALSSSLCSEALRG